jgi:zinc/manganese transport system substrate-binding protein
MLPSRVRPLLATLILEATAVLAAGCGSADEGASSGQVKVVATTTQIADFAREVGGDRAAVVQLLKPNTDPHEYEPRPSDVRASTDANVVLENGDNLDRWMSDIVEQAGGHPTVIDLGSRVPVRLAGESSGPEASRYDPHWWHDLRNAQPRSPRSATRSPRPTRRQRASTRATRARTSASFALSTTGSPRVSGASPPRTARS